MSQRAPADRTQVVLTCTQRKALPAVAGLEVGMLPPGKVEDRAKGWLDRLAVADDRRPAADLYQGEHWSVARTFLARPDACLHVASAGLGLIAADTAVPSYDCTFAAGAANSVVSAADHRPPDEQRVAWWQHVQAWTGLGSGRQSLMSLVCRGPVLLVASPAYLVAMESELRQVARGEQFDRVVVIAAGVVPARLRRLTLQAQGSLRTVLGGTLGALNARLAVAIHERLPPAELTRGAASGVLSELQARSSPLERFERLPLSDDGVVEYILRARVSEPAVSSTALHRRLRNDGFACEQARFRRLFKESVVAS